MPKRGERLPFKVRYLWTREDLPKPAGGTIPTHSLEAARDKVEYLARNVRAGTSGTITISVGGTVLETRTVTANPEE